MPETHPYPSPSDLGSPLLPSAKQLAGDRENERVCIDDMLRKYCGEFGAWQWKHFVLTSLAWVLEAFHTMVMIFADREPEWRCVAGPGACSTADGSVCGLGGGSWEWIGGRSSSSVSEWGLICGERYKVGLVQSLFFGGCMIGAGTFGHLSDSKLGRKGSLTVVCILNTIFGLLTSISPGYWTYAAFRLLTGFSTGGVGLCAFVLSTEPVGPTKRGVAGMSTFYFFSGGIAVLSGVAYVFRSWRSLYFASAVPSILFLVFVLPFISESPRWYLVRGKTAQAMKIMRNIAETNGKCLPENVCLALDEDASSKTWHKAKDGMAGSLADTATANGSSKDEAELEAEVAVAGSLIDVLRTPLTRFRLFLVVAINLSCSVVYYGLSLNVVNLKTNLYLNVLLNAVAEIPAYFLTAVLLDRLGRKPLGVATQWFSGLFCVVGSLVGSDGIWKVVRMVCGILGIFGVAGTYNLLFIYTVELFPTVVRNAALGCATQATGMGAILTPFVVVLGGRLPLAVFGTCGVVGGFLTFYLPETLHRPLYDTMTGMEDGESAFASVA